LLQSYRKAEEFTNLRNCQCWAPLFLQDIKTDAPIAVDIRMKDLCLECNLQNAKCLEHDRHFIVSLTGRVVVRIYMGKA